MAQYTINTTAEQEAGLEHLRVDGGYETKQALIDKMIKDRAERRLRDEHKAAIVDKKTITAIKTELDA